MPSASILWPLIILVFINDTVEEMNPSIRLFADDIGLNIVFNDPLDYGIQFNENLLRFVCLFI